MVDAGRVRGRRANAQAVALVMTPSTSSCATLKAPHSTKSSARLTALVADCRVKPLEPQSVRSKGA
jgi:hypothetical protein